MHARSMTAAALQLALLLPVTAGAAEDPGTEQRDALVLKLSVALEPPQPQRGADATAVADAASLRAEPAVARIHVLNTVWMQSLKTSHAPPPPVRLDTLRTLFLR